jgi:hypothetical protein
MEQSPSWEANIHSASEEISYLLWGPKVHYCVHILPPYLPKNHYFKCKLKFLFNFSYLIKGTYKMLYGVPKEILLQICDCSSIMLKTYSQKQKNSLMQVTFFRLSTTLLNITFNDVYRFSQTSCVFHFILLNANFQSKMVMDNIISLTASSIPCIVCHVVLSYYILSCESEGNTERSNW